MEIYKSLTNTHPRRSPKKFLLITTIILSLHQQHSTTHKFKTALFADDTLFYVTGH